MYKGDKENFGPSALAAMEERKQTQSYIRDPDPVKDLVQEGDTYSGRILYDTYCTACHQRDGKGDNNRFPPLADSEWVTGSEEKLIGIVLNGMQGDVVVKGKTYNGLMPAHGHLDDHAIASILSYVRKRFGHESKPVSAVKVSEVRTSSATKRNP
jgi:mono/diheme cytochrome c family protein